MGRGKLAFYLFHLFRGLETLVAVGFGPGTDVELMMLPAFCLKAGF